MAQAASIRPIESPHRHGDPSNAGRVRPFMLYLTGADLLSAAAVHAGCDFFAGYPITPASSILKNMLAALPRTGGVGVQAEDEISSISMTIAASMAGRRAMTATSGPGISLMSESLGLAQMAEVPLVVVDVQRMGPATGGATTNAEGDIQFVRWVSSGGYPMVVYAPWDLPSTWALTLKAFDTAERLRTPVVLLTSKNLIMTSESVDENALQSLTVTPRRRGVQAFRPYDTSESDVPPFLVFGEDLTRFTTSIHDERGLLTESPDVARRKLERLIAKINDREDELGVTEVWGERSDVAIVAAGSPARSARAAWRALADAGHPVRLVILGTLAPLPERALARHLRGARHILVPELNPGLLAPEIERLAREARVHRIGRIDGGLISPEEIAAAARGEMAA